MSTMKLETRVKTWNGRALWRQGWQANAPLMATGVFSAVLLLITMAGLVLDPRTLIGEPIWLKPTKFAISSAIYALTLVWLLQSIQGWPRLVRVVSWVVSAALFIELVLIVMQAVRGVRSHFNIGTALDAAVFSTMGTAIAALWVASIVVCVVLLRQRFIVPAWGASLKFGLLMAVVGAGLGWLMTTPSAAQMAQMSAGNIHESGSHLVGLADGEGGKLPVVGWSTEAGDLRIGHFIGLHGMQILPLLGYFILRQNRRLSGRQQTQLVWVAGLGYLGVIALTTWQALRGEPLIYPGALTLAVWVALVTAVASASGIILIKN